MSVIYKISYYDNANKARSTNIIIITLFALPYR